MVAAHRQIVASRLRALGGSLRHPLRVPAALARPRVHLAVLTAVTAFVVVLALLVAGVGGVTARTSAPAARAEHHRPAAMATLTPSTAAPSTGTGVPPGTALRDFAGGIGPGGTPPPRSRVATLAPPSTLASGGIPATALSAYRRAATVEATKNPGCHLPWPLLAGIGRVESDHGRFAGAVLHSDGVSTPAIIGIPLDGNGTAVIRDTDGGRLDGDTVYDRAVGPMQFIPSTWARWGRDGNHDGRRDPFNVFDAAAAAADYLCAAGRDLGTYRGQVAAVLSYNHSSSYVAEVLGLEKIYAKGVGVTIPVIPTDPARHPARHVRRPTLPPVDPGPPRALLPPPPSKPRSSGSTAPAPARPSTSSTAPAPASSDPAPPPSSDAPADPPTDDPTTDDPTTDDPSTDDPSTDAPPTDDSPTDDPGTGDTAAQAPAPTA